MPPEFKSFYMLRFILQLSNIKLAYILNYAFTIVLLENYNNLYYIFYVCFCRAPHYFILECLEQSNLITDVY